MPRHSGLWTTLIMISAKFNKTSVTRRQWSSPGLFLPLPFDCTIKCNSQAKTIYCILCTLLFISFQNANGTISYIFRTMVSQLTWGPLKISDFVEATVCGWMIPRGVPMAVYSVSNEQNNNAFTFVQTNILAMELHVNGHISRSLSTL